MTNENSPDLKLDNPDNNPLPEAIPAFPRNRVRVGLVLMGLGWIMLLVGAKPAWFGLDRSEVIGFIQISVFLLGLGIMIFGCYFSLAAMWQPGKKTIVADIGLRLVSTGYTICFFTGMADILGFGSHHLPGVYFGQIQERGVQIGLIVTAIGLLCLYRFKPRAPHK